MGRLVMVWLASLVFVAVATFAAAQNRLAEPGVLLRDSSSPASHQRLLCVYAGALVVATALSLLLPARPKT